LKDNTLVPSTQEEYDRTCHYFSRKITVWSDSTDVDVFPDDVMLDEDSGIYFQVDGDTVSLYNEVNRNEPNLDLKIQMIVIDNLEDLQYTGLSSRGRFAVIKLLGLIVEFVKDDQWHTEVKEYKHHTYKMSYKITEVPMLSIKKVTMGIPVRVKRSTSAVIDF
jgi:hypothetical protein